MGVKDIKYSQLADNYKDAITKVNELFTTIESISTELQGLSSCWEGSLSLSFSTVASKFSEYSNSVVSNLKNTEEYKNCAINSFKSVENTNIGDYKIT